MVAVCDRQAKERTKNKKIKYVFEKLNKINKITNIQRYYYFKNENLEQ